MSTRSCLPQDLTPFVDVFNETFRPRTYQKGTLLCDTLAFSQVLELMPPPSEANIRRLPSQIHSILAVLAKGDRQTHGVVHSSLIKRGMSFKPFDSNPRQGILAFGDSVPHDWSVGRIKEILTLFSPQGSHETLLIIEPFKSLSNEDMEHDFYRQFGYSGGRIYYDCIEASSKLISHKQIIAHVAYVPDVSDDILQSHFLAIPQDRVRVMCSILFSYLLFDRIERLILVSPFVLVDKKKANYMYKYVCDE